jgi:hypothetical protein
MCDETNCSGIKISECSFCAKSLYDPHKAMTSTGNTSSVAISDFGYMFNQSIHASDFGIAWGLTRQITPAYSHVGEIRKIISVYEMTGEDSRYWLTFEGADLAHFVLTDNHLPFEKLGK